MRCKQTTDLFREGVDRLEPGHVPEKYLILLFGLLKSAETPVRKAVIDHLCKGQLQSTAAQNHGVKQGSISRQVKRLTKLNQQVIELAKYHK